MVFIRYIVLVVSFWVHEQLFSKSKNLEQIRFSECWRAERQKHFPACNADHRVRSFGSFHSHHLLILWSASDVQNFFPSCNEQHKHRSLSLGHKNLWCILALSLLVLCQWPVQRNQCWAKMLNLSLYTLQLTKPSNRQPSAAA